jgi:hypothetical protein
MKDKFKNVKPGQKLWSLKHGKLTVDSVWPEVKDIFCKGFSARKNEMGYVLKYEIMVRYKFNGKMGLTDKTPDLYFKKPVILTKNRLNNMREDSFSEGIGWGEHIERLLPSIVVPDMRKQAPKQ